jgi:hypothetical protein
MCGIWTKIETIGIYFLELEPEVFHINKEPPNNGSNHDLTFKA